VIIDGIRVPLERGKNYRILYWHGSADPKPLTTEENERATGLFRRLLQREDRTFDESLRMAEEFARLAQKNQPLTTREEIIRLGAPGESGPTDSESIVIDLRNR
jgi:hypothetical protein